MKRKVFKILSLFLLLNFILIAGANATNDDFSINVPDNYTKTAQNVYARTDQNNFNIQITENTDGKFYYNERFLNEIVSQMSNQFNESLRASKDRIKETFKESLTDEQVDAIIDSIKFKGVVSKEITTFTKNIYPAFHYTLSYSMNNTDFLADIYQTGSGDKIYTLTFTQATNDYLKSDEVKAIMNSFTINNYIKVASDENVEEDDDTKNIIIDAAIGGAVGAIIVGIVGLIKFLSKKNKKEKPDVFGF